MDTGHRTQTLVTHPPFLLLELLVDIVSYFSPSWSKKWVVYL